MCSPGEYDEQKNQSFQMVLLQGEKDCSSPELGYTLETSWPVLQKSYPSKVIHTVNLDDIETYNWTKQTVTLTEQESKAFSDIVSDKGHPSLICPYAFLVLRKGTPVYGGKIIFSQSPIAIQFPVMYVENAENKLILVIRPFHSIFPIDSNDPAWQVIKDNEIEAILNKANKLTK